jgi:uncharacterized Zn finger protein (UPF0148 family)
MNCLVCDVPLLKLESEAAVVCPECGRTSHVLTVTRQGFSEDVTHCVYSRTKRFETMLRALLYPSFDQKDTLMYKHLSGQKRFETIHDLEDAMKTCKVKEKRFFSLHLFAKLMCQDYNTISPPPLEFFKRVMFGFDEVLTRFNTLHMLRSNFFSYPWLMKSLLNLLGETRYDKFIKKIRCKKRNEFYETMFKTLIDNCPEHYLIKVCAVNK